MPQPALELHRVLVVAPTGEITEELHAAASWREFLRARVGAVCVEAVAMTPEFTMWVALEAQAAQPFNPVASAAATFYRAQPTTINGIVVFTGVGPDDEPAGLTGHAARFLSVFLTRAAQIPTLLTHALRVDEPGGF
jgi:hypothetical protein